MEQHFGWFAYDSDGPIGPQLDWQTGLNTICDAAGKPVADEAAEHPGGATTSFVNDGAYVSVEHEGPFGFIYEGDRCGHTYDDAMPGITVTDDPGPVADDPVIVERKAGDESAEP
jgi:hypothetical protein